MESLDNRFTSQVDFNFKKYSTTSIEYFNLSTNGQFFFYVRSLIGPHFYWSQGSLVRGLVGPRSFVGEEIVLMNSCQRLLVNKLKLQYYRMEKRFEYKTTAKVEQTERMRTSQKHNKEN